VIVEQFSSDEWKVMAANAHLAVFDESRPAEMNRIDFALLAVEDEPIAYGTFREIDNESVYMQYGGVFPPSRNSIKAYRAYEAILSKVRSHYKRASTLIENTNLPMMKFAMKAGLRVTGIRNFKGSILLEHSIEWEN
jgi:hypothetical protein